MKLNHATSCFNVKFSSVTAQTSKSKINRVSKGNHVPSLIFPGRALPIERIKCTYYIERFLVINHPLNFVKSRRYPETLC